MIKISTDDGRFKFLKERHVETVYDFINHPWMFDYDSDKISILIEAYEIMNNFIESLEPKSIAWLWYCSEDGMKCDRGIMISKDYVDEILKNLHKMIH